MSIITDAVLYPGTNRFADAWPAVLEHVTWQYDDFRQTSWQQVDVYTLEKETGHNLAGGNKVFTLDFWLGSFNHLAPGVLAERVRSAPWKWPAEWVLVTEYEFDDSVAVWWHDGQREACRGD